MPLLFELSIWGNRTIRFSPFSMELRYCNDVSNDQGIYKDVKAIEFFHFVIVFENYNIFLLTI